ncbi:MAG: hypothetical protein WC522_07665 [Candidatus Omnitrophota bacterium]
MGAASVAIAKGLESSRQASQVVAENAQVALSVDNKPVVSSLELDSEIGPALSKNIGIENQSTWNLGYSNDMVLGRYPDYVNVADQLGARRFQVPMEIWSKMSNGEQWAANVKALERTIERGGRFILGSPVEKATPGTGFFNELQHLVSKGYRISSNGKYLIPPPSE